MGVVGELGKHCGEGLVVGLFHSRKEGSAEGRGKAHRCGKRGELPGGLQKLWGWTLGCGGGGFLGKGWGDMVTAWCTN